MKTKFNFENLAWTLRRERWIKNVQFSFFMCGENTLKIVWLLAMLMGNLQVILELTN